MWTVISRQQKGRRVFAVLILAGILIVCVIFAYLVQQYKRRAFRMDLDTRIRFTMPAGAFSLAIASDWQELPSGRLPPGIVGGWRFTLPQIDRPGFFYIEIVRGHPVELIDFARIVIRYSGQVQQDRLRVAPNPDRIASLTHVDVGYYPLMVEGRLGALAMKVFYLPNDFSLILTMTGSGNSDTMLRNWLEQTAGGLNFQPGGEQTDSEVPSVGRRMIPSPHTTAWVIE